MRDIDDRVDWDINKSVGAKVDKGDGVRADSDVGGKFGSGDDKVIKSELGY